GDTKKENICSKVAKDLEDAGIKKRYVYKILPDEYKRDYDKQKCPRALSEMIGNDPDQKKPIEITNDGSQITSSDEKSSEYYDLDEIHGGKSLEQMRREANHEIEEDKEGTLENPS